MNASKTVIVTGGNAGLGYECARTLAAANQGWHVVIAGRDPARIEAAAQQLRRDTNSAEVEAMALDLASLESVRAFADAFGSSGAPSLQAIVCNAGTQMLRGISYTVDGFETTFGVNHLGHFLLVNLLLPLLVAPARIVVVSSGTHDPDMLDGRFTPPDYRSACMLAWPEATGAPPMSGIRRYATSKLCNLFFAYELARRLEAAGPQGITVNAYDPGATPGTGLVRDYPALIRGLWETPTVRWLLRRLGARIYDVPTSGQAMARLVLDPALANVTGRYFHVQHEAASSRASHDRAKARDLWETSAELVGLEQPAELVA